MEQKVFDAIVDAQIQAESAGNPLAVSPVGAKGLMQLMDATGLEIAAEYGIKPDSYDPFNPKQNRLLGSLYLRKLLNLFGEIKLALAAYNCGMGRVSRLCEKFGDSFESIEWGAPRETRDYVRKIQKILSEKGIHI